MRLKLNHAFGILAISFLALGCTISPPEYTVPPSFSIHYSNDYGPVVGLKIRISRFKNEEFSKADPEQQRTAKPEQFTELIAESVTDRKGEAHFSLTRLGRFDLEPDHPAAHLDLVGLNVVAKAPNKPVNLKWPSSTILSSPLLHGRLVDGLMSSVSLPLQQAALSLRSLVSFEEIGRTTTGDDGNFRFDGVPQGVYFLHMNENAAGFSDGSDQNEGDIPIYVGPDGRRKSLSIATDFSDCGLSYDLEENKPKYKPLACFRGGKPVACTY